MRVVANAIMLCTQGFPELDTFQGEQHGRFSQSTRDCRRDFCGPPLCSGIGINLGQSGPATAGAAPRQSLADMQREQMQMAREAMEQASQMQHMHQQHMRMMEAEMMGDYGAYDDYATGRDPFSDVDFSDWE